MATRDDLDDLRGLARLAVDATRGVASIAEAVHRRAAGPLAIFSLPAFAAVRGVASAVGGAVDRSLATLAQLSSQGSPADHGRAAQLEAQLPRRGPQREVWLSALNGVIGDRLAATHNPLAIRMTLRRDGRAVSPRDVRAKLAIFIHGSSMSDFAWRRPGGDYAAALAARGYTTLDLHYNTGLHISENGRALSTLLEEHIGAGEIAIIGHSMGGLVARSACHAAGLAGHRWLSNLRSLVFLGTPHHGAPLERYGNLVGAALGISGYSAPFAQLGELRSAGVTDLRFGNVRDEDWRDRNRHALDDDRRVPLPLPRGVRCFTIAGDRGAFGDGLVPVASALGQHPRAEHVLAFPLEHRLVLEGTGHVELLNNPRVRAALEEWL